jgi:segregation and condensation protein B
MGDHDLVEILEGALLAAGEPLSKRQLAQLFDELERPSTADISSALDTIAGRCEGRGFELAEVASGFSLSGPTALVALGQQTVG